MADDNNTEPPLFVEPDDPAGDAPRPAGRTDSAHFFRRGADGTVRVRIRFSGEDASLFEEAAGTTRVIDWMLETLRASAHEQVRAARERRPAVGPPVESAPKDRD